MFCVKMEDTGVLDCVQFKLYKLVFKLYDLSSDFNSSVFGYPILEQFPFQILIKQKHDCHDLWWDRL